MLYNVDDVVVTERGVGKVLSVRESENGAEPLIAYEIEYIDPIGVSGWWAEDAILAVGVGKPE